MNENHFKAEIKRLCSQWPNSYGTERLNLLWGAFRDVPESAFTDAVTDCLLNQRSAPLVDELSKAAELAKTRASSARISGNAFANVLGEAATHTGHAEPDYVRACMAHLNRFLHKQITRAEFDEGCDRLDDLAKQVMAIKRRPIVKDKPLSLPYKDSQ
jgi:hypothetical protein